MKAHWVMAVVLALSGCDNEPVDFVLEGVTNLTKVGQITGPETTGRFAVHGTDLGSMFTLEGRTYYVFGDTFSTDKSFWRSNVMGYTNDTDPSNGITLDGMITDDVGFAKELLPSKKVDNAEMTVIPTYGFAVGTTMYLHYMSVRHWGKPGEWETNHSGLAKSTDRGQTWTKLDKPQWGGESNFVQVSVARFQNHLYFWSIPAGRFGGVKLMRVPVERVEKPDAYEYFASQGRWDPNPDNAVTIVDDTVGELSVQHNGYLDRWIMTYLKEGEGVVIREGLALWGPWGEPKLAVSAKDHPGLYAPFLYESRGQRLYFNLSLWEPYNVFIYSVDLQKGGAS